MKYLTYLGNDLIHARLPDTATIHYPPRLIAGIKPSKIPDLVRRAFENPLGMEPLKEQVSSSSRVLIALQCRLHS